MKSTLLNRFLVVCMFLSMSHCSISQTDDPCPGEDKVLYFGVEHNGMLCGYATGKQCTAIRDEKELAIQNYQKSLQLNPNSTNGKKMLEELIK